MRLYQLVGEDHPGELVEKSKLDTEIKHKLLYKNALEFLGLDEDHFLSK
jgi:predicted TIM-barrel fold metal-dependent hydrolase